MVYGAHGHGCSQGPRDRRPRGHHLRRGHLQGHDDLRRDHRGERHHPADAGVVRVRRLLPPEGGGGGERHPGRASQRVWHRHSHRRRARSSLGARHHGGLHDVADNVGRRGGLRARGRDHRPVGCQCGHRHGLRPVGPELHRWVTRPRRAIPLGFRPLLPMKGPPFSAQGPAGVSTPPMPLQWIRRGGCTSPAPSPRAPSRWGAARWPTPARAPPQRGS
mmetsp:Transcript_8200/g.26957  ORF Transcript_8200/g.26957 Transcript_8200/m.26957 type:complete len:219 (-) Transcript_8200:712-1368(-)